MAQPVNITVLVGNGFDLSAQLNVSASDVLQRLVKENRVEKGEGFQQTPGGRLAKTIEDEGIEVWSALEDEFGKYAETVSQREDSEQEYLGANDAIEDALENQIKDEEKRICGSFIHANAPECARSLADWRSLLTGNERRTINRTFQNYSNDQFTILCFNYTSVLQQLLMPEEDVLAEISAESDFDWPFIDRDRFLYPHGTFHGGSDDVPVFGVDNAQQIQNDELNKDPNVVRAVVKSENLKMNGTNVTETAMRCIDNANIVMIYGMSLGKTDARWWKRAIEWLRRSNRRFLILFSHEAESKTKRSGARSSFLSAEKRRLFEAAGMQNHISEPGLQDRIFIVPSEGFLTITEPLQPKDKSNNQK